MAAPNCTGTDVSAHISKMINDKQILVSVIHMLPSVTKAQLDHANNEAYRLREQERKASEQSCQNTK